MTLKTTFKCSIVMGMQDPRVDFLSMSMNLLSSYFRVKKMHLLVNGFAPVLIVAKANDNAEVTFFL